MSAGHPRLHAAAHAMADSLASGLSFLGGMANTTVWADAVRDGKLSLDLLNGTVIAGRARPGTQAAFAHITSTLPEILAHHRLSIADYGRLVVHFQRRGAQALCDIEIESADGRLSQRRYVGPWPLRALRMRPDR